MTDQEAAILKRLHDAVNREISKRLQTNMEMRQLHKRVIELERDIRKLLHPSDAPAADRTLQRPRE